MHLPIDEYLVIGNKLFQLYLSSSSGNKVFIHSQEQVWYDKVKDGPTITAAQARQVFPEYFV